MKTTAVIALVLGTLVAAGCGGKAKAKGRTGQFAEFGNDEASVLARLQGTWFVPEGTDGQREVWQVSGDKVVVHHTDGATHETRLDITTPCNLGLTDRKGKLRTGVGYAFGPGDVPYLSDTMIGVRSGKAILLCGIGIDLHRDDKCSSWTEEDDGSYRKLQVPLDPCPLRKEGEREVLELPKVEIRLVMVGDAAVLESSVDSPLVRVKDLAEGKALLAKPLF